MNSPGKFASFKATAAKVWALSTPYFRSEEKWKARGLLAAIVVLNLAAVYMLVLLNDWNRVFYDALQNKDQVVFWQQLGRFSYLAFAFIIIAVYKFYLTQLLEVNWRAWMTRQYYCATGPRTEGSRADCDRGSESNDRCRWQG